MPSSRYRALLSTDWNECLAPSGPFDCIVHSYPHLAEPLDRVFRDYTGNRISLAQAVEHIGNLLPTPVSRRQIDAFLDQGLPVYPGVLELFAWCRAHDIAVMINTTGMIGFFQCAFERGLLPVVAVLSAHPFVRFAPGRRDPEWVYPLLATGDKGRNTAAACRDLQVAPRKVIVMGDSGGDGPHFRWGREQGAVLIGSMTKASLTAFCREVGISIDHFFGPVYMPDEVRSSEREMACDFMGLVPVFEALLAAEA